jgi:hypothetical protein
LKTRPKKLTVRQEETLRKIHDLTETRGIAPTISELANGIGVSSDQAVIELLERLDANGFIDRTAGRARGIRLTTNGYLAIGIPVPVSFTEWSGGAAGTGMTIYQQRIVKRLADIDPKLSRMYLGGLRALCDEENPERIAQSAHSIRETTYHLSNLGKDMLTNEEEEAAKTAQSNNARQLERVFDPLPGVRYFQRTLYDMWNKEFHQFFVEVSHHGREVTLDEYVTRLNKFEEFLNLYVLPPQTDVYEVIDAYLKEGPAGTRALDLELLLSRNLESYRYFFRHADSRWLGFLQEHQFLISNWETAGYLARITPDAPAQVMAIIEQLTTTTASDWMTRRAILEAAMKMPPELSRRLIPKIEQEAWLESHAGELLSHQLEEFLGQLITCAAHQDALRLARVLLSPTESRRYLHSYHYGEFLKQFSLVPAGELLLYLELLSNVLRTALMAEHPNTTKDHSSIWRPTIEDTEQNWGHGEIKDLLVTALRNGLERYTEQAIRDRQPEWKNAIHTVLATEPPYSIFVRLQLHLFRLHPSEYAGEIETAVLAHTEDTTLWHEYSLLVQFAFSALPSMIRERYLALVDAGPQGELAPEYTEPWQARRLAIVREHLSSAEKAKRAKLLAQAARIQHADLLAFHTAFWGPSAPTTAAELARMPIEAMVEYLATWVPGRGWDGPSKEGLGRELSAAVGQNATAFSREAARFADVRLQPVYVYHFLLGLLSTASQKEEIVWEPVVDLMSTIVTRACRNDLPSFTVNGDPTEWEPTWDGVYQEIGSVLKAAFHSQNGGPSFALRERIWTCIEFLCEQPNPTSDYELQFGGKNMDPFTLSINTVRGTAFHALFAYVFWCDRHRKALGEHTERIVPEAKAVMQRHLDRTHDPSLAVRSVYGRYFPWLYIYEPAWATKLISQLFPSDNVSLRYAAWETYLSNSVFEPVYKALRQQYEQAIRDLRTVKGDRRFWSDPVKHLAMHLMTAYAYRLEEEGNPLWEKFFRLATAKERGIAVAFCGGVYAERAASAAAGELPSTERLQEFWDWRLSVSKDVDELRAFGCWVQSDKFSYEWLLEHLVATLRKTRGVIDREFTVLASLRIYATQYPLLCTSALELLVKAKTADRIMLGHNEDIDEILKCARGSGEAKTVAQADRIIDYLTRLGFESYRSLQTRNQQTPAPADGVMH